VCRNFGSAGTDDAFTTTGYNSWHHALVQNKRLKGHASSKEHMSAMVLWKDRLSRVKKELRFHHLLKLERNRAAIFIAENQLPFHDLKGWGFFFSSDGLNKSVRGSEQRIQMQRYGERSLIQPPRLVTKEVKS